MNFNIYHSTCSAVLALVSLFAFGLTYGHSKTAQSGYQIKTVGNTEVISEGNLAVSTNELLTDKKPGTKAQAELVWIPVPYKYAGA